MFSFLLVSQKIFLIFFHKYDCFFEFFIQPPPLRRYKLISLFWNYWYFFLFSNLFCGLDKTFYLLFGNENDKYAIWCPHVENHWPVIEEAVHAYIITFEVIIFEYTYRWWRGNCENSPLPTIGGAFQCVKVEGPFHQPLIYALGSQNVAHSLVLR